LPSKKKKRSRATISRIMALVRSKGTDPEIQLRKELRKLGRKFRVNPAYFPGSPDFLFPAERIAIFVDGDFWHGHQWRLRGLASLERQFASSKNKKYWIRKIKTNVARDKRVNRALSRLGWRVIRLWESDLKKNLPKCLKRVRGEMESFK